MSFEMSREVGRTGSSWPAIFVLLERTVTAGPRRSWPFYASHRRRRSLGVLGVVRTEAGMISFHTILTRLFIVTFYFTLSAWPASGAYTTFQHVAWKRGRLCGETSSP
jgi:hypothetical protein